MTKFKILISAPYMIREKSKVEEILRSFPFLVEWANVKERLEEEELLKILPEFDGIICGDDRLTKKVLERCSKLKTIVKWGTGIDSIDTVECKKRDIKVFRTPNAFTEPVADTSVGMMLYFLRGLGENDGILKRGGWDKPYSRAFFEFTVGLIGFGAIGQAVAKRIAPFGATILVNDLISLDDLKIADFEIVKNVKMVSKEEIFERSEIISLHCDLNSTSFHILDSHSFGKMKKTPIIINTARGPLIEEGALVKALKEQKVRGAGLDVFESEPLPLESPLRQMNQVILSAHNSNSSPLCWERVHKNSIKMLAESFAL